MVQVFEITIQNRLSEIRRVEQQFNMFSELHGIPIEIRRNMNVVFDEMLSNIISYAYSDDNEHDIDIIVELFENRLGVLITDDGIPFNPLSVETLDTHIYLEDRRIGGLGIHLVRNIMDKISYQRRIDKNVITLVKYLNVSNQS